MNNNYNHHYVPQSILRNFAYIKQTVYSLRKVENLPIKKINVKNLCQERAFYEIISKVSDDSQKNETINYDIYIFEKLDREIAPLVKNIIANEDLKSLTSEGLDKLSAYTTYQYLRCLSARKIGNQFWNDEEIRLAHAAILTDYNLVSSVASLLSSYQLNIINPIAGHEFVISDSPVLWDATSEGIYFPISPNICLYYHHQKYGLDNCLDSICINYLQFRASVIHTIARSEAVLYQIKNNVYKDHILKFCTFGKASYWKCLLEENNSSECIAKFQYLMVDFQHL